MTSNPRTTYGAEPSADVLVLDRAGRWTNLSTVPGSALSTDLRQGAELAVVDFSDGVDEFNNQNSTSGTLEERALIKPLIDDDVTTMEMIVINRFSRGTRIGEAFVRGDGGSIGNGFLIDRAGIAAEREAWTQSHEAGHILLDQPWHPDNMGPDRPWLLMDADASLGTVAGPKRISTEECARIRSRNGPDAPSPRRPAGPRPLHRRGPLSPQPRLSLRHPGLRRRGRGALRHGGAHRVHRRRRARPARGPRSRGTRAPRPHPRRPEPPP